MMFMNVRTAVALGGLLVGCAAMAGPPANAQGTKPKQGGGAPNTVPAPDFTLKDLDGKSVTLSSYRGKKVVVIDFWATWCGPCRFTMPLLQKFHDRNKGKIEVLSIDQQEDPAKVAAFIKNAGYTFRVLIDPDNGVSSQYRVYGIPTLFVIDKSGGLAYKHVGARADLDTHLEQIIAPLL